MKVARTVLNGESGSNAADLHNRDMEALKRGEECEHGDAETQSRRGDRERNSLT